MIGIVARSPELLRFLDRLAHGDLEVEIDHSSQGEPRRRVHKAFAPLPYVVEVIKKSNPQYPNTERHLNALLRSHAVTLGLAVRCPQCQHTSWFSLQDLAPKLSCPRCLGGFEFPSASPPHRNAWAYRVIGPFAVPRFADGAYCVATALHFLTKRVARQSNWIPSFKMEKESRGEFEADFAMIAAPSRFSHRSSPDLIIGECKSFNRFEDKDFARARAAAELFPGAVLCFCTFNESLDKNEIRGLTSITMETRRRRYARNETNPILIFTARELFSEFKTDFYSLYADKAEYARGVYLRDDMEELCDFTQQLYLGMAPYYKWAEEKRRKRLARRNLKLAVSVKSKES